MATFAEFGSCHCVIAIYVDKMHALKLRLLHQLNRAVFVLKVVTPGTFVLVWFAVERLPKSYVIYRMYTKAIGTIRNLPNVRKSYRN